MSAPENVTGDRLDRVEPGQFVHLTPMVLGDETPDDGWSEVDLVLVGGGEVTLVFMDASEFTGPENRLVRIGWS